MLNVASSGKTQVAFRSACATFNEYRTQLSFETGDSGWSIYGGKGRSQTAYFAVGRDAEMPGSNRLRILLDFSYMAIDGEPSTLGRFRLSVSADADAFTREKLRLTAMKVTDPWSRLAAAYGLVGDQQSLDKLLKHRSAAAARPRSSR
jgi:hypothetical protein